MAEKHVTACKVTATAARYIRGACVYFSSFGVMSLCTIMSYSAIERNGMVGLRGSIAHCSAV